MGKYDSVNGRRPAPKRGRRRKKPMNMAAVVMLAVAVGLAISGALIYFLLIRPERKNNGKVPEVNTTEAEQTSGGLVVAVSGIPVKTELQIRFEGGL